MPAHDGPDVAVIGGGAAGLAAATWVARYRRSVVVFDRGEPRNRWVRSSHGYLGADGVDPAELLARARRDLERYETASYRGTGVGAVTGELDRFVITSDEGDVTARRVVLATGVVDELPAIGGLGDHYGRTVFTCGLCDGYEARDQDVVVLGLGPGSVRFARGLLTWARSVTVVPVPGQPDLPVEPDPEVSVTKAAAVALVGADGELRGVSLEDGETLEADVGFLHLGQQAVSGPAAQLGCELDGDGFVVVDGDGATTVPGVFAAGDCTPGPQLVQVAAAQGAMAGIGCAASLG